MKTITNDPTSVVLQALQAQNKTAHEEEVKFKHSTTAVFKEHLAALGADVDTLEVRNSGNSTYGIRLASDANWYREIEVRVEEGWNYRRRDTDKSASRYFDGWYVNMPSRKIVSGEECKYKSLHLLGFAIAKEALNEDSTFAKFLEDSFNLGVSLIDASAPLREAISVEVNRIKAAQAVAHKAAIVAQVGDFYTVGKVWAHVKPARYAHGELKVEMRKVIKVTPKRVYVAKEIRSYSGGPQWSDCGHVDIVEWEKLILRSGMRPVSALLDNQ